MANINLRGGAFLPGDAVWILNTTTLAITQGVFVSYPDSMHIEATVDSSTVTVLTANCYALLSYAQIAANLLVTPTPTISPSASKTPTPSPTTTPTISLSQSLAVAYGSELFGSTWDAENGTAVVSGETVTLKTSSNVNPSFSTELQLAANKQYKFTFRYVAETVRNAKLSFSSNGIIREIGSTRCLSSVQNGCNVLSLTLVDSGELELWLQTTTATATTFSVTLDNEEHGVGYSYEIVPSLKQYYGIIPSMVTPTPSPTLSSTISITPSVTKSSSVVVSPTPSPTVTVTPSVTKSVATSVPAVSVTPSPSTNISPTPTITITPSVTISASINVSPTPSPSPTRSVGVSVTPTITITPSVTASVSVSPQVSVTPSVSHSVPGATVTPSPTITVTPSVSASISVTPTPSVTPSPS